MHTRHSFIFLTILSATLLLPAIARADRLVISCPSCQTVSDFSSAATADWQARGLGSGTFHYWVVNTSARLMGRMRVQKTWEQEFHRYIGGTTAITSTVADMQQLYRVAVPDQLAPLDIPSSVATTFTGTSQASAVDNYLHQHYAGSVITLNTTLLVVFPDGSNAIYQLTSQTYQTWDFVSGSGSAADGTRLDDNGNPISATAPGPTLTPPFDIPSGDLGSGADSGQLGIQAFLNSYCEHGKCYVIHIPN